MRSSTLMKFLIVGVSCVVAGAVLMLNGFIYGEYLCIFGVLLVAVRTCYIEKEEKELKEVLLNNTSKSVEHKDMVCDVESQEVGDMDPSKTLQEAIDFITSHDDHENIVSMYKKGPPAEWGFMWYPTDWGDSNSSEWFTLDQHDALKTMKTWVVAKGWDSSGYAFMQRRIQNKVREIW